MGPRSEFNQILNFLKADAFTTGSKMGPKVGPGRGRWGSNYWGGAKLAQCDLGVC